MALGPGSRLDQYELLAVLGTGGMGEVYKARDLRLDRLVAVKVITSARGLDAESRERFEREARSLAALSHPNICQIFEYGDVDGAPFLVMEYLEGETVSQRLQARGTLPLADVLRYGLELAAALAVAHRAGIVHRDLKPDNIMLTATGLKLLDLGIAKRLASVADASFGRTTRATLTGLGVISGTLTYMAPEQLEGHPVDTRSDMFSFGAVLYEMVTGRRAFEGTSQAAIIASIMTGVPIRASTLQRSVPPKLDALLDRCLQKRPGERFRDVSELRDALEAIPRAPAVTGEAVADDGQTVRKRKRRRIVISFSISISFLIFLAAFITSQQARPPVAEVAKQAAAEPVPAPAIGSPAPLAGPQPAPISSSIPPAATPPQAPPANRAPSMAATPSPVRSDGSAAGVPTPAGPLTSATPPAVTPPSAQAAPRPSAPAPEPKPVPPPSSGATGVVGAAPAGAATATPPEAAFTPEAQARREIEQLARNYCAAMETLQPEQLRKLYPQVDVALYRDSFRQYRSLKCTVVSPVEFDRLDASPAGGAQVKFGVKQQVQPRVGNSPLVADTIVTMVVSRQSNRSPWLIDRVQFTPKSK